MTELIDLTESEKRVFSALRVLSVVFFILALLVFLNPVMAFWLKAISGCIAYGRSSFQLLFLLLWVGSVLLYGSMPTYAKLSASQTSRGYLRTWVLSALAFQIILSALSFWIYSERVELKLMQRSVVVAKDTLSSTALWHIHTLKPVMAYGASLLGIDPGTLQGDSGVPFMGLVPAALLFVSAFMVVAIAIGSLALARVQVRKSPEFAEIPRLLSFGLVSFGVLKWSLDGGFFNPTAAALLIGFIALSQPQRKISATLAPNGFLIAMAALLPLWGILSIPAFKLLSEQEMPLADIFGCLVTEGMIPIAIVLAPMVLHTLLTSFGVVSIIQSVALSLAVVLAIFLQPWYQSEYRPLSQLVPARSTLRFIAPASAQIPGVEEARVGSLTIHSIVIEKESSVRALYAAYGLRMGITQHFLVPENATPTSADVFSAEIRLLAPRVPASAQLSGLFQGWHLQTCTAQMWCTYFITATLASGLTPLADPHLLIVEQLRSLGFPYFVYRNQHLINRFENAPGLGAMPHE